VQSLQKNAASQVRNGTALGCDLCQREGHGVFILHHCLDYRWRQFIIRRTIKKGEIVRGQRRCYFGTCIDE
jgi:hypothetical protein